MCRLSAHEETLLWQKGSQSRTQTNARAKHAQTTHDAPCHRIASDDGGAARRGVGWGDPKKAETHSSGYGFSRFFLTALSHRTNLPSSSAAVLGGAVLVKYLAVAAVVPMANGNPASPFPPDRGRT